MKGEKVWVAGLGIYNLPTPRQPEKGSNLWESGLAMCYENSYVCAFIL